MKIAPDFKLFFDNFIKSCLEIAGTPLFLVDGRRYVKVLQAADPHQIWTEHNGSSVFCFVDKKTGNVLKSSSWTKPDSRVRGNIFDTQGGLGEIGPIGVICRHGGRRPQHGKS